MAGSLWNARLLLALLGLFLLCSSCLARAEPELRAGEAGEEEMEEEMEEESSCQGAFDLYFVLDK